MIPPKKYEYSIVIYKRLIFIKNKIIFTAEMVTRYPPIQLDIFRFPKDFSKILDVEVEHDARIRMQIIGRCTSNFYFLHC